MEKKLDYSRRRTPSMEGPTLEVRNVRICNWRWHQMCCVCRTCVAFRAIHLGRRVVRSDLGGITRGKKVAVYWRWPKATGNIQGEWHEAAVKSSNRRGLGTMTVEYDEEHSLDTVNIEEENVVWMDPVGNIDAEEDLQNEDPQRVAPKKRKRNLAAEEDLQNEDPQRAAPKKRKRPECKHGK